MGPNEIRGGACGKVRLYSDPFCWKAGQHTEGLIQELLHTSIFLLCPAFNALRNSGFSGYSMRVQSIKNRNVVVGIQFLVECYVESISSRPGGVE